MKELKRRLGALEQTAAVTDWQPRRIALEAWDGVEEIPEQSEGEVERIVLVGVKPGSAGDE